MFKVSHSSCTDKDIHELVMICGPGNVVIEGPVIEDCSHDEMSLRATPDVVVFPSTAQEVSQIMKYASSRRIPVTPRGSGTGLCGGAVPVSGGIVMCLSRMDKILEVDRDNLTMTVESGVLLMTVHETARNHGYLYAPDPGEKTATIGGNISTNAGGMRAIKYGSTRANILGLEVVLPDGQSVFFGGKQVKKSTGYSLMNLVIGSEGTLGVVTKAVLKLLPLPARTLSLLVPFNSLGDAVRAVPGIFSKGVLPQSIEFAERNVILAAEDYLGKKFPHTTAPAYLMIRVDGGSSEETEQAMEVIGDLCLESGASDVLIANTVEREQAIWDGRGAFLAAVKSGNEIDECDVVLPRSKIAEFVEYSKEVSGKVGIRIESFGHAGDGNLHIYVIRDGKPEEVWEAKRDLAMALLYEKGHELGGLVSGEHGIGYSKKKYMRSTLSGEEIELMEILKRSFDPLNILNPGKVV